MPDFPHSDLKYIETSLVEELFDRLTDTVFFVKDFEGRYLTVSQSLVLRCGRQHKSQLIGKAPSDILGGALGKSYEAQDREVIETGKQILDQLELHVSADRSVGWCMTSKWPLKRDTATIDGLIGISRDLQSPHMQDEELIEAIERD